MIEPKGINAVEEGMTDIWSRIEIAELTSGKTAPIVLVGKKEWAELHEYPELKHEIDPNVQPFAATYSCPLEVKDVTVGWQEMVRTEDESRLTLVFDREEVK